MSYQGSATGSSAAWDGAGEISVLVVGEDDNMRSLMRQLLKQKGLIKVDEADGGRSALDRLRAGPAPDVVICDANMARMDGIEFCNAVRRDENLKVQATPILLLTGQTDRLVHEVAEQVGAAKVAVKPISADELVACVQEVIGYSAG